MPFLKASCKALLSKSYFFLIDRDRYQSLLWRKLITIKEHMMGMNKLSVLVAGTVFSLAACVSSGPMISQTVKDGNTDEVRARLEKGANPNQRDHQQWPVIHNAAAAGHADIVQILIDAGADVNLKDNDQRTALMKSSYFGHTDVVRILLENGADQSYKDNLGEDALKKATYRKHPEIVALLEEYRNKN